MEIVFVWLLLAAGVGVLANSRGRSGFGFFLLSVLLSPLLGLVVVLVSRNLVQEEEREQLRREEHERQIESIRAIAAPRPSEAPQRATSNPAPESIADEIKKLAELKNQGLLTDSEFQMQKSRLLGLPPSPVSVAVEPRPDRSEEFGTCPNCSSVIPVESPECPKCKANFGPNSVWRVVPKRRQTTL